MTESHIFHTFNEDAPWNSTKDDYGEEKFRRISAYVLSVIMLLLLSLSIFLNWYEGSRELILPLALAAAPTVGSFIWLRNKNHSVIAAIFLMCGTLAVLGGYLLLKQGAPNGGSLLWFAIFPSMAMFSLGLRYGTTLCAVFYAFLLLLLLTPLSGLMPEHVPASTKVRLLLSVFGAFVFSWCAEYVRHKTHRALIASLSRLEQEAITDPLTGLGNRRDFDRYFDWISAQSKRNKKPFSLAVIDIDRFKKSNDLYGHKVGDMALKHLAGQITAKMRDSDRLFRWGGEEFILVMPDSNYAEAMSVAERIRQHIENTPFNFDENFLYHTISIGLYSGIEGPEKNRALIVADKHLYTAKNTGRNRVVGGTA